MREEKYISCPEHVKGGLKRYIEDKVEPGSFLVAVLSNDLFGAFGQADMHNRYNMFGIVSWIYNNAPNNCHGSREIVDAWLGGK